jgi:hypothetical protein
LTHSCQSTVNFVVVHNEPHDVVACGRRPLGGLRETASRFANIEISDDVRDTKFRLARRPRSQSARNICMIFHCCAKSCSEATIIVGVRRAWRPGLLAGGRARPLVTHRGRKVMIRSIAILFAVALAPSAEAMPPAPIQQSDEMVIQVREGCGAGMRRTAGVPA